MGHPVRQDEGPGQAVPVVDPAAPDVVIEPGFDPEAEDVDRALALEWAQAMADGSRVAAAPDEDLPGHRADPILDPEEIDSLLNRSGGPRGATSGTSILVDNPTVSYERLPMLEVVFERLVRIMTTSLRTFTSEPVEVAVERFDSLRFGDYLAAVPLPALMAVFRAVEWENLGLVMVDSPLIYSIVDVLLGGRRGGAATRLDSRPYTTIERSLVERLMQVVLHDLGQAFEPLSPVTFRFDRLETNPRFAAIARPTNAAILLRLRIEMDDRRGHLELIIPYATLEPVRNLLLQMFMGEKFGRDPIWEGHLSREILATQIELEALLDERMIPLGAIMRLEVGQTLPLGIAPERPVVLRCGQVPLMRGRLGRSSERIAIRIDERVARDGDEREREPGP